MAGMVFEAAIGNIGEVRQRLRTVSLVAGSENAGDEFQHNFRNANCAERAVLQNAGTAPNSKHPSGAAVAKDQSTTTMMAPTTSTIRRPTRKSVLPTVPESSTCSSQADSRRKIFPTFRTNHWVWTKADPNQAKDHPKHLQNNVNHQFQNHLLLTPISEMHLFDPLSDLPELLHPQEPPKQPEKKTKQQQLNQPLPQPMQAQLPRLQPLPRLQLPQPKPPPKQENVCMKQQNLNILFSDGVRPVSSLDDSGIRYGNTRPLLAATTKKPASSKQKQQKPKMQLLKAPQRQRLIRANDDSLALLASMGSLSPREEEDPFLLPDATNCASPTSATALSRAAVAARTTAKTTTASTNSTTSCSSTPLTTTAAGNANSSNSTTMSALKSPLPRKTYFFKDNAASRTTCSNGVKSTLISPMRLPRLLPNQLCQRSLSAPCTASATTTPPALPYQHSKQPRHQASILKSNPKYSCSLVPATINTGSSLPSLLSLKESEDGSQSSADHDHAARDQSSASGNINSSQDRLAEQSESEEQHTGAHQDDDEDDDDNSQLLPATEQQDSASEQQIIVAPESPRQLRKVLFDPRIWIREFHRAPEEETSTWYSNDDMERFKRLALDRILRYQSPSEIVPTGTGRTVQRPIEQWKGPIYSHAALTLDGENEHDDYMRKKVLEKELQTILIVDPHDLCLKLFSKAFQCVLPRTTRIVTAKSSGGALKELQQGQRFDVVIVEERLQLFHRNSSSSSSDSSESADTGGQGSAAGEESKCYHENLSSGAELIESLAASPVTSTSVFIGVSSRLEQDRHKLQKCGADFVWSKPPPPVDQRLLEELLKTILIKRGRTILAMELFGGD